MNLFKVATIGVIGWLVYRAIARPATARSTDDLQQRRRQAEGFDDWLAPEREPSRAAQSSRGFGR